MFAARRQEQHLGRLLTSMDEEPPMLALVMIARNEQHCIERCLESVKPYVDVMIVLDTGSTDQTKRIAGRSGAQVLDFEWCNDFAAARNAALSHSPARWNLILDADEWIERDGAELLKAIRNQQPFVGFIRVASEYDLQGNVELATSWIPRLLPKGVRYEGEVHEQPVSDLPRKRIAVEVGHSGYRREQLDLKKGRNRTLLRKMLDNSPSDRYLLFQLGRDYEVYQEFSEAVDCFVRALEVTPESDPFRHELVIRLLYCLKHTKEYELAVQFAESEMSKWQQSPDYFFVLGDLLLDWTALNPDKASELIPMIESCWLRCLEIGDQPELEGTVIGRGSHLAAYNLSVVYGSIGDEDKAERYRDMATRLRAGQKF